MSTPIRESIMSNIETVVNTITTANGYNQDLSVIRSKRVTHKYNDMSNGDCVLTWLGDDSRESTSNIKDWTMEVSIFGCVIPSDDSTDIDPLYAQVASDIEKALKIDHTRGGYAIDTIVTSATPQLTNIGEGINVVVEIYYRTNWGDPYNLT